MDKRNPSMAQPEDWPVAWFGSTGDYMRFVLAEELLTKHLTCRVAPAHAKPQPNDSETKRN